ncbi:UNVERIFIED_CONTAM: hypothetical protein FKN15_035021 [Acipenser sinensis]
MSLLKRTVLYGLSSYRGSLRMKRSVERVWSEVRAGAGSPRCSCVERGDPHCESFCRERRTVLYGLSSYRGSLRMKRSVERVWSEVRAGWLPIIKKRHCCRMRHRTWKRCYCILHYKEKTLLQNETPNLEEMLLHPAL